MICLCLLSIAAPAAWAQVDQGTITGIVQDPSNAVVPSAAITLTNTDTGLVLQGKANGSGFFVFSPLKIGNYQLTATAEGFQTTTQEHIHLDIQQRLNIVLTLKPGAVSQTVTVSDAPPLLQTQEGGPMLYYLCQFNPFTHAVELIRFALYGRMNWVAFAVVAGCTAAFMIGAIFAYDPSRGLARRSSK